MTTVEIAREPLDTAEIGTTLMYENALVLSAEIQQCFPEIGDEDCRVDDVIHKLSEFTDVGVDRTVIGRPTMPSIAILQRA